MTEGFALHEIILDKKGNPVDYRFLEINPAFEALTGLKATEVVNKTVLEVLPGIGLQSSKILMKKRPYSRVEPGLNQ